MFLMLLIVSGTWIYLAVSSIGLEVVCLVFPGVHPWGVVGAAIDGTGG